jgi:hypothetical protein
MVYMVLKEKITRKSREKSSHDQASFCLTDDLSSRARRAFHAMRMYLEDECRAVASVAVAVLRIMSSILRVHFGYRLRQQGNALHNIESRPDL